MADKLIIMLKDEDEYDALLFGIAAGIAICTGARKYIDKIDLALPDDVVPPEKTNALLERLVERMKASLK